MRTARPLVTWSRITLCGPSASSLSISTPRLIGPGCMMRRRVSARSRALLVRPNRRVYSPRPGKIFLALPLVLDAQEIDDVGVRQARRRFVRNGHAQLLEGARHQRARADQRDARAQFRSGPKMFERATRLKRMSPMMATCRPAKSPVLFANREEIEQRLRRMLVRAVAGIDHAGFQALREEIAPRPAKRGAGR